MKKTTFKTYPKSFCSVFGTSIPELILVHPKINLFHEELVKSANRKITVKEPGRHGSDDSK